MIPHYKSTSSYLVSIMAFKLTGNMRIHSKQNKQRFELLQSGNLPCSHCIVSFCSFLQKLVPKLPFWLNPNGVGFIAKPHLHVSSLFLSLPPPLCKPVIFIIWQVIFGFLAGRSVRIVCLGHYHLVYKTSRVYNSCTSHTCSLQGYAF